MLSSAASCLLPEARLTEGEETRELIRAGAGGAASSAGGTSSVNAAGGTYRATSEAGAAGVLNGTGNTAGAGARPSVRDAGQSSAVDLDGGSGCGGACGAGEACVIAADCESGVCAGLGCDPGTSACCQAPSCDDGVANGAEPAVDCGNVTCGLCATGSSCGQDAQCLSGFCELGRCADPGSCTDFIRNGTETGVDCGGARCPVCRDLSPCREHADCFNNNCSSGICISCGDATLNGTETDIDCGGPDPFCVRCAAGQRCQINTDCASGFCFDGFCG